MIRGMGRGVWAAAICLAAGCRGSSSAAADGGAAATGTTINDGTDANRPELAPEDRAFTDTRDGWGWSDRCWKHLGAAKLGWAKAACARGMEVAKAGEKGARPSLLYNQGLIEERAGNPTAARALYEQSLALRPNAEVGAALGRVGGHPPAIPAAGKRDPSSFACGNTRCTAGQTCCPGAKRPCVASGDCGDEDNPGSETLEGYFCDPKTGDGCPVSQKCVLGKVGRGPMTITANCQ